MIGNQTTNRLRDALSELADGDFSKTAEKLLGSLGYRMDDVLLSETVTVGDFITDHPANNPDTKSEHEFAENTQSVRFISQISDAEIIANAQRALTEASAFDTGNARSFLFLAVELIKDTYNRGQYAAFTREINKRLQIPTVVLFKTAGNLLTFAFAHRRLHRRDPGRDVLGNVFLIREIDPVNPHRAHIEILDDLSLPKRLEWMIAHGKPRNFDGLLEAWLDALDTEELNRRFYRELFDWFERAVAQAKFPKTGAKVLKPEEHVIRLITRLLFVWFIKEKGLVAEDLFIENRVCALLQDYDQADGDSYYRAVLQNLFFATLNTEIGDRRFSKQTSDDYRNYSVYRYRKEMAEPDALTNLLAQTPFINGGLFDCLDDLDGVKAGGVRIDCFTDNAGQRRDYSIPNSLFFGEESQNPGLITLFNRYKFTVEENTPAEQEVALDPELLGKVFENLLAAYNPETKDSARKQTGSYYTPRAVVDYMVDEALVASIVQKVAPDDANRIWWEERLHYLLDYSDAGELFLPEEADHVIRAIADLKVLDPAVGSGAFPMGVLHKLTLALRRLDPDNRLWRRLQEDKHVGQADRAIRTPQSERDRAQQLEAINESFERYQGSDFGRKLYLIQNSIYGVDIQPVATQIAKLRFFISLAIEQQPTGDPSDNYGIQPLPNLETRFVSADTLLGLDKKALQIPLGGQNRVAELNDQLRQNRERHFHAGHRQEKLRLRREDTQLRDDLAAELQKAGMSKSDSGKIAAWDPYDQNAHAKWFDSGYMFDVRDGFDVVIGNPPYVEARNSLLSDVAKDAYRRQADADWGADIPRGSDLLIYFLARSARLLGSDGVACLITQNAWLSTDYGKSFQDLTRGKFSFYQIIDTSAKFFSDSQGPNINAVIALFGRQKDASIRYSVADADMQVTLMRTVQARQEMKWGHLFAMPEFFEHILEDLNRREDRTLRKPMRFGQGINVRKEAINAPGADVPTLLESAHFVAMTADSAVPGSAIGARASKIPALIMPRGLGRHYCAFNYCKAHSFSGVDLYLSQALWESDLHYCLWVYLNSSLAWLFREVTGRRNLGGGMLKAEATDMKALPIGFAFDFLDDAQDLYNRLQHRDPLPVQEEVCSPEHLRIDEIVGDYFGIAQYSDSIREALLERVNARESRARHRS